MQPSRALAVRPTLPSAAAGPSAPADQPARIAVVHDWLDTWGGSEHALEQILALYPQADVFALIAVAGSKAQLRLAQRKVHTSFLQRLPWAQRHFRAYLPLFPAAIESLDVSAYDLVISSSHAVAKGARTHPHQLHVCYCYTPMRYAWDLREQYLDQLGLQGMRRWIVHRMLDRLRRWDGAASIRVDCFVAISQYIAKRIERCYGRTSNVIYPPVVLPGNSAVAAVPRDVYVTVSRLVPYKRVDAIAAAFRMLPDRRLVIIGDGPERRRIQTAAGPNVRLLGQVDNRQRDEWLARARAFVFAAEEDFGIAPVEAQAHGTPVIAYRIGGSAEIVRGLEDSAPTGVFFDQQTPAAIADAVKRFEVNASRFDLTACRDNVARFSDTRFRREFAALIERRWIEFRGQHGGAARHPTK